LNCRKVSGLLSAYLDRELTVAEADVVSGHLDSCSLCRSEYESLRETKQMLASLAFQTSRVELEELLLSSADRSSRRGPLARFVPEWLSDRLAYWGSLLESAPASSEPPSRFRAVAATALLSLAGICLASASLNGPREEAMASAAIDAAAYPLALGANLSPGMRSSGAGMIQAAVPAAAASPRGPVFLGRGSGTAMTVSVDSPAAHPGWIPMHPAGHPAAMGGTAVYPAGGHWHLPSSGGGYGIVPTRQTSFIYRHQAAVVGH